MSSQSRGRGNRGGGRGNSRPQSGSRGARHEPPQGQHCRPEYSPQYGQPSRQQYDFPQSQGGQPSRQQYDFPPSQDGQPSRQQYDFPQSQGGQPSRQQYDFPQSQGGQPSRHQYDFPQSQGGQPSRQQYDFPQSRGGQPSRQQYDFPRSQGGQPSRQQYDFPQSRGGQPSRHQYDFPQSQGGQPSRQQYDFPQSQGGQPSRHQWYGQSHEHRGQPPAADHYRQPPTGNQYGQPFETPLYGQSFTSPLYMQPSPEQSPTQCYRKTGAPLQYGQPLAPHQTGQQPTPPQCGQPCTPQQYGNQSLSQHYTHYDSTSQQTVRGAEGGPVIHHGHRGWGRGYRPDQRGMRYGKNGQQRSNRGKQRGSSNKEDFDRGSSMSLTDDNKNEMGSQSSLASERGGQRGRRQGQRRHGKNGRSVSSRGSRGTGREGNAQQDPYPNTSHLPLGLDFGPPFASAEESYISPDKMTDQNIGEVPWGGRGGGRGGHWRGRGRGRDNRGRPWLRREERGRGDKGRPRCGRGGRRRPWQERREGFARGQSNIDTSYKDLHMSRSSLASSVDGWEDEEHQEELGTLIETLTDLFRKKTSYPDRGSKKEQVQQQVIEINKEGNVVQSEPHEGLQPHLNKTLKTQHRTKRRRRQSQRGERCRYQGKVLPSHEKITDEDKELAEKSYHRDHVPDCGSKSSISGDEKTDMLMISDMDGDDDDDDDHHHHHHDHDRNSKVASQKSHRVGRNKKHTAILNFKTAGRFMKVGKGKASNRVSTIVVNSKISSMVNDLATADGTEKSNIDHLLKMLDNVSMKYGETKDGEILTSLGKKEDAEREKEKELLQDSKDRLSNSRSVRCSGRAEDKREKAQDRDCGDDEEMDVRNAFKTLLTKFDGRARMEDLQRQKTLFPPSFFDTAWLKRHKGKFLVFESKNGLIEYVSVYSREAKLCVYFNGPRGCTNKECDYLHVCSGFVTETCKPHIHKCPLSHNFLEKQSAVSVTKMGLDEFKNKEIAKIVRCTVPEVCREYNQNHPHEEETCPYLHVCDQFPCSRGPSCKMEHKCLSSEHNLFVLSCFHIRHFKEHVLAKIVLGRNRQVKEADFSDVDSRPSLFHPVNFQQSTPTKAYPEATPFPHAASYFKADPHTVVMNSKATPDSPFEVIPETHAAHFVQGRTCEREFETSVWTPHHTASDNHTEHGSLAPEPVQPVTDPICDGQYLCEKYIWGTCTEDLCPHYHGYRRVPYQWQIELKKNIWQDFPDIANDQAESHFCDLTSTVRVDMDTVQTAVLNLDTMTARLSMGGQERGVRSVRRLSTRSYCQGQGCLSHLTSWCWYWLDNGHIWKTYDSDKTQYSLEKKYLHGQREYYFELRRFRYMLSFTGMTQLNLETKNERQVLRRPIYVSVRDVQENQILSHPALMQQSPKEMDCVPSHWTPLDLVQPFELVRLHPEAEKFVEVERSFHSTLERIRYPISKIFQVQNPTMWDRHCSNKRSMEHTADREGLSSKVNERMLYHGTDSEEVVRGICVNGFDHRVCGKNGTVYGRGAYFAVKSSYSNCYTGGARKRYMFRARVLVGQHTTGTSELTRPPCRKGHTLYDSCVDNIHNPSIFVLFDQNQSYPEFLIEYDDLQAPVRVPTKPSVINVRPPPVLQGRGTVPTGQPTSPSIPPPTQKNDSKCVVM